MRHNPLLRLFLVLVIAGLALAACDSQTPPCPACPDCPACTCSCPDPVVGLEGTTNLDTLALGSNLTVAGTASFGSTVGVSGAMTADSLTTADDVIVGDKVWADTIDAFTNNNGVYFVEPIYTFLDVTAVTTDTTISTADRGELYTNQGATAELGLTLPSAYEGLHNCVYVFAAYTVTIDVQTGDQIHHLTNAAGDEILNAGTAGDSVCLVAVDGTYWVPIHETGTWSDNN